MSFQYPLVRFKCKRCAKCCGDTEEKLRLILLLENEAQCISKKTEKHVNEFAENIQGYEPYAYVMKKTLDRKCLFLKNNLCSIYPLRPLICRFYPFQLEPLQNNTYKFSFTRECPGIGEGYQLKEKFFKRLFEMSARLIGNH